MKKSVIFLLFFIFSGSVNAVDLKFWKIFKKDKFIVGINYPWNHYGADAGINPYGEHMGFSAEEEVLNQDFAEFKKAGITHVRFFLFADGRGQFIFDKNGSIRTFQPVVIKDIEALTRIAGKYKIKLILVLYDNLIAKPGPNGEFINRYPEIIFSENRKQEFFKNFLIPVLRITDKLNKKYSRSIYAIEPMNEPEYVSFVKYEMPGYKEVLIVWLQELIQLIEKETSIKSTLGFAHYPSLMENAQYFKVDFWQFHYYSYMEKRGGQEHIDFLEVGNRSIFPKGKIVIGELDPAYTNHIKRIKKNDFAGVFFWSYKARDRYGSMDLAKLKSQIAK